MTAWAIFRVIVSIEISCLELMISLASNLYCLEIGSDSIKSIGIRVADEAATQSKQWR